MGGRRQLDPAAAWAWLVAAPEIRVAAVVDGQPLLRTMHAAALGRRLVLHGAPRSEKSAWVGSPVVVAVEEVVARIPSWMRHPEKACPATTFYRSVQARGRMVPLDDPDDRAAALQVLMEKLQPEGRHRPLSADDPLYRGPVRGLAMWAIEVDEVSGVSKVGQHLDETSIRNIIVGLWERGGPGDLSAVEQIAAAHPKRPPFMDLADGLHPRCFPGSQDVVDAVALVRDAYWNTTSTDEVLAGALRASPAWVGVEREGQLVGTARAVTDRTKRSWIYDVAVAPQARGVGVGQALMQLMLAHPATRQTEMHLGTRDAMAFYDKLGFRAVRTDTQGPYPRTHMVRSAIPVEIPAPAGSVDRDSSRAELGVESASVALSRRTR